MLLVEMAGIFVRVADERMPSGIACNRHTRCTRARKLGSRSTRDSRNSQRAGGWWRVFALELDNHGSRVVRARLGYDPDYRDHNQPITQHQPCSQGVKCQFLRDAGLISFFR